MKKAHQMSLGDYQANQNRKVTRSEKKLSEIDRFVNWDQIIELVSVIDRTDKKYRGRPRKELLMMSKILFIQHLHNLSDPELEDQLNDRLSFQRFAGIGLDTTIPDHSTRWRFKEALIKAGLTDELFEMITEDLESKRLFVKKGTIVDAMIIKSGNRRRELNETPSRQIDRDARSTKKNGKYYYYKGHIGTDVGSKLIRSRSFTSANIHDSTDTDKQKRRNRRLSSIRSQVEHTFAYMKRILNLDLVMAKTLPRNELRFTMNCIIYNIMRTGQLTKCSA